MNVSDGPLLRRNTHSSISLASEETRTRRQSRSRSSNTCIPRPGSHTSASRRWWCSRKCLHSATFSPPPVGLPVGGCKGTALVVDEVQSSLLPSLFPSIPRPFLPPPPSLPTSASGNKQSSWRLAPVRPREMHQGCCARTRYRSTSLAVGHGNSLGLDSGLLCTVNLTW